VSSILQLPQVEGPLGFPLTEKQARNLDALLKLLPNTKEYEYRKTLFAKAPTELNPGERSDVSWISTETPDRYGDVMFAKGMNDSQYALNPIVTLNHSYSTPPIGRSLWRKFVKDGDIRGIKAKTVYPPKPDGWDEKQVWQPDQVFAQVQAGLLNAKSIGWVPTKAHFADPKEAMKFGCNDGDLLVEEWLLIEYAVGTIPVNPETVVQTISKTLPEQSPPPHLILPVKFTHLDEIERAIKERIESINLSCIVNDIIDQKRGRI
jgi:hypothetical protein